MLDSSWLTIESYKSIKFFLNHFVIILSSLNALFCVREVSFLDIGF
jgi:hypothetical protein